MGAEGFIPPWNGLWSALYGIERKLREYNYVVLKFINFKFFMLRTCIKLLRSNRLSLSRFIRLCVSEFKNNSTNLCFSIVAAALSKKILSKYGPWIFRIILKISWLLSRQNAIDRFHTLHYCCRSSVFFMLVFYSNVTRFGDKHFFFYFD